MKILFVHNRYLQSIGGEDMTVEAEVKLLREHGHEISVEYFSNDHFGGNIFSKIKSGISSVYNIASKKRLTKAIGIFKPDIIHVHNFYFEASPSVFDAAYDCGVPVVYTVHNYRLVCVNALLLREGKVCEDCLTSYFPWKGVIRKCYHSSIRDSAMVGIISASYKLMNTWSDKVDRFITPSAFMKNKLLLSSLPVKDANKIQVKGNFIEDPGFQGLQQRNNQFLFIGRISEEKGINFLLSCFAKWEDQQLIVVGDGPEKESLSEKYAGAKNIIFAGKQNKESVLQFLKTSKALIFPSIWYEGLPVTLVEALATGTPVIASNLGAMKEMIAHGYSGLLYEKESMPELQNAIITINKMVSEGDVSFSEGARETYLNNYHPDICYQKIMSIYESVIHERKAIKRS